MKNRCQCVRVNSSLDRSRYKKNVAGGLKFSVRKLPSLVTEVMCYSFLEQNQ